MWFKSKEKEEDNKLFTDTWLKKWLKSIKSSNEYKKKGNNWSAKLILKFNPIPELFIKNEATGIYLDLKYGQCKELRYSKVKDEAISDLIISADEQTWIQLMEKGEDPTSMIMNNRLTLEKGSLVLLSTQRKAAKSLLQTTPTANTLSKQNKGFIKPKNRTSFISIDRDINFGSTPMNLYQQNQTDGNWRILDIDYSKDREDWKSLNEPEQSVINHFISLLLACEEASFHEHISLLKIVGSDKILEDQLFMSAMVYDESKHIKFYSRYSNEVTGHKQQLSKYHGPHFKSLLYTKLSQTMVRLERNPSPIEKLKAFSLLNIIVKGTLKRTCFLTLKEILGEKGILPGMAKGISNSETDESRHDTFALFYMNRILRENKGLKESTLNVLDEFLDGTTNVIQEIFSFHDSNTPFEIKKETLLNKAITEYQKRVNLIE